jgi:aromatic ring-cleaving dioxygenase
MTNIKNFHAHVYFEPQQFEQAQTLCNDVGALFPIKVGTFHQKPVGPHPVGMCQLTVENDDFSKVIPWLMLNRDSLVLFIHPETGDPLADHTKHAIWAGQVMPLDLSIFSR